MFFNPAWEAFTIQGQYAIPQPDLIVLNQLAMQHSHFPMMHGNARFSASLSASAQTTSHKPTIPNDMIGCIIRHQKSQNPGELSDVWDTDQNCDPIRMY